MTHIAKPVHLDDKLEEVRSSGRLEYRSKALPTWCPGCGYFAIVDGVATVLKDMGIQLKDAVVVSGIGCASRFPFFLSTYGIHSLHGRVLPVATGVKIANERLTVIAVGGDGDGFAIGGCHVPHAARRNIDITYLLFDNGIYGLTKGQVSPTSALGFKTPTSPYENMDQPLNPLLMVLSHGASWVGQAYAGHPEHLRKMIAMAAAHRGFSFLNILSPCVTFDRTNRTYSNLGMAVCDLPADHNPTDRLAAMAIAQKTDRPALGLYYHTIRPTLGDNLDALIVKAGGTPSPSCGAGR
ncbi:MAG: thiamine pyrophosphate-dependent enzyme [Rhodospirillaceae bacterium]